MDLNLSIKEQVGKLLKVKTHLKIEAASFWLFFFTLMIISTSNFLAFHTVVELFSSAIGLGIFMMCVNTFPISKSSFILILGIGYAFVGLADIFHAFTYPGINMFGEGSIQIASQFWIVARYIQMFTLLLSSLYVFNKLGRANENIVFLAYLAVFAVCAILILSYRWFPECYVPEEGPTLFKRVSECIIALTLIVVGIWYYKKREGLDSKFFICMELNIIFTIISELILTSYILPYEVPNTIANLLKALSFFCIYKGVFQQGLKTPYSLMYNSLHKAQETINSKTSEINLINSRLMEVEDYSNEVERVLADNEACFQFLLQKTPLTIYAHSEGRFIFANSRAAELLGLEREQDLTGRNVTEFVPEDIRDKVNSYVNGVHRTIVGEEFIESRILSAKGKVVDVNLARTVFNYKGKPAYLCVLWDMRNIQEIEGLKRDVLESRRLLDQSLEFNKLIKEFFANLSHELRTPLNVILGALQVTELGRTEESTEAKLERHERYGKIMKQNCYRLLRLINNLIDMSKIDAGFFNLNLRNHNIINVVEDITLSVTQYMENKGVNLIFDTDVEEKIMACDPDKLERVILNLLSNAIKFTSPGDEIMVCITDKEDSISISVKDTGIGIPQEKLEIIFDRFRQVDSSLSRNREGSGIGLSLVKSFVEMHGGSVSVKSTEGEGSEFTINIPARVLEGQSPIEKDMNCRSGVEALSIEFSDIYS